ncbi:MAG TPA: hypothetical protein VKS01_05730, partial [Bryobacteraceae bacterium]|nr:hypothetical protein [Bryobacteraceae bacterium]
TIIRSPARLLYVVVFVLALAFGKALDFVRALRFSQWMARAVVGIAVIAQIYDLGTTARLFVHTVDGYGPATPRMESILESEARDARVAVSIVMSPDLLDRYDDASGYDSIFLADTYRDLLPLMGVSPRLNEEIIDAASWPVPALEAAGVKFVITWDQRKDLEFVTEENGLRMYRVANPRPRATAQYERPSSDEMVLRGSGTVEVLEAWDPGWDAKPYAKPDGLGMSVTIPPGKQELRLRYRTPGRWAGVGMSLASIAMLIGLAYRRRSRDGRQA